MLIDPLLAMPLPQLLAFVGGGLALNLAPGPDVLFATASGLRGGPRAGVLAGLGVGIGVTVHVLLASLGLGALVAAHPAALTAIRWAGAAYLLWLAWGAWHAPAAALREARTEAAWGLIGRGALTNLLNPKPVLFLLAYLPQFARPEWGPLAPQILALGLLFAATGTVVTSGYGWLAGRAGGVLARRLGWLNRIAAVIFAGLALRLVAR